MTTRHGEKTPWEWHGCSRELYEELRGMHSVAAKCPIGRFLAHRRRAKSRGIEFRLTLAEWWVLWRDSGHYAEMGTRVGQYNMTRQYDRGAYAVGNVSIETVTENQITKTIVKRARRSWSRGVGTRYRHTLAARVIVADREGRVR